jgi:hypothetical protein
LAVLSPTDKVRRFTLSGAFLPSYLLCVFLESDT